ncbi:class I SAM-dependent methyltransferase [Amycolatopsis sp. 195334CR]|uniref:class I SAM-dependent methyltransferase n=1 Tax=Amycolatopsis sp. 195334CR TaxID=2814588 RepID=UPI001A8EA91E|nr:class I SAM-dependent methyltransferase [Amycolatopsis sp. 195334CR]MBN6035472.1 class I SAM-dependent methyltransferase [Amycolatopsis sp. 195334CR]
MVARLTTALAGAIVAGAGDRSALSDELHFAAEAPAERVHLDRGRANLVRALDLPARAKVLHLGAGSGSLTRYLAESVSEVDAVEPDAALAKIIEDRTAGLTGVRVLSAMPDGHYDVVVAVGVLETLLELGERTAFLRAARDRLAPGGTLCLAVENQFGVRNLAGAPDRHTGRRWDAVEGHPFGGPTRLIARRPLGKLLGEAGFGTARVLGCFPDFRFTRVVFDRELLAAHPRLAIELPRLPSPDEGVDAPRPVDEAKVWAQLVEAGQAEDAANAFLVLATVSGASPLWPEGRLAKYFNTDRAARWCTGAEVTRHEVRREPLLAPTGDGPVSVQAWTDPIHDGPTMVGVLAEQPWLAEELLTAWRGLVHEHAAALGPALWDLLPHNIVVTGDGALWPIDLEWRFAEADPATVVARGLLLTAERLAGLAWPGAGPSSTVRDLAAWLGALLGVTPDYVEEAVDREARFQAIGVHGGTPTEHTESTIRAAWRGRLAEAVAVRDELPGVDG